MKTIKYINKYSIMDMDSKELVTFKQLKSWIRKGSQFKAIDNQFRDITDLVKDLSGVKVREKPYPEISGILTVVKYDNRKLYANANYINLSDLIGMLHSGRPFRVINSKTFEDVTAQTLRSMLATHAELNTQQVTELLLKHTSPIEPLQPLSVSI